MKLEKHKIMFCPHQMVSTFFKGHFNLIKNTMTSSVFHSNPNIDCNTSPGSQHLNLQTAEPEKFLNERKTNQYILQANVCMEESPLDLRINIKSEQISRYGCYNSEYGEYTTRETASDVSNNKIPQLIPLDLTNSLENTNKKIDSKRGRFGYSNSHNPPKKPCLANKSTDIHNRTNNEVLLSKTTELTKNPSPISTFLSAPKEQVMNEQVVDETTETSNQKLLTPSMNTGNIYDPLDQSKMEENIPSTSTDKSEKNSKLTSFEKRLINDYIPISFENIRSQEEASLKVIPDSYYLPDIDESTSTNREITYMENTDQQNTTYTPLNTRFVPKYTNNLPERENLNNTGKYSTRLGVNIGTTNLNYKTIENITCINIQYTSICNKYSSSGPLYLKNDNIDKAVVVLIGPEFLLVNTPLSFDLIKQDICSLIFSINGNVVYFQVNTQTIENVTLSFHPSTNKISEVNINELKRMIDIIPRNLIYSFRLFTFEIPICSPLNFKTPKGLKYFRVAIIKKNSHSLMQTINVCACFIGTTDNQYLNNMLYLPLKYDISYLIFHLLCIKFPIYEFHRKRDKKYYISFKHSKKPITTRRGRRSIQEYLKILEKYRFAYESVNGIKFENIKEMPLRGSKKSPNLLTGYNGIILIHRAVLSFEKNIKQIQATYLDTKKTLQDKNLEINRFIQEIIDDINPSWSIKSSLIYYDLQDVFELLSFYIFIYQDVRYVLDHWRSQVC